MSEEPGKIDATTPVEHLVHPLEKKPLQHQN